MNPELLSQAQSKLIKSKITLEVADFDQKMLRKIPSGAVFVCNQLLPGLDEWILLALLAEHFENVKILHPYPTPPPKSLKPHVLLPSRKSLEDRLLRINFAKRLTRRVRSGAAVALSLDFSDNPLSHLGKNLLRTQTLRQIRKSGQSVIPVHLQAERMPGGLLRRAIPGLPFHLAPGPVRVSVRVGTVIPAEDIANLGKNRLWGKFLQAKIFSLGSTFDIQSELLTGKKRKTKAPEQIADPIDPQVIATEIAALSTEHKVAERGQFDVLIAPFEALPQTMFEIGRLRELTFRAAGEGTGKARDMDEHDLYYLQLIIWDREKKQIAGGYRLGLGDRIFERFGVNGFYSNSLFKMKPGFFPILQKSVELGRTYVPAEYQKHRLPLFLLWKGILHFLLRHPEYRYLLGPVSISKDYSEASKGIIVEFVRRFFYDQKLAALVAPRKAFRPKIKSVNTRLLAENLRGEFEALESLIETIEPAHFKVPVLFRQYLRQNAKFIAFNVDPNFSNCLDGLMILDIAQLPVSTIEVLQQEK
ncbi:MAG: GNAT family N-acetyltransferase [Saprospiraceae bacterium]|nr:GNAT family N-acetyltransferase [Saprospiraceae bacterium]